MIPILQGEACQKWLSQKHLGERNPQVESTVKQLLQEVKTGGDQALTTIAKRFGDPIPRRLSFDSQQVAEACRLLPDETKRTIEFAAARISAFAQAVMDSIHPVCMPCDEYTAGLRLAPVERAACYVPAGRYPLPSTALMTAGTAAKAGVKDIAIFSPALKPEIIFSGITAGASEFFEIGGAQAIAAAAFGTDSIKAANIIVGPGNAYVVEAKRQVNGIVGIDMLAGPSEIAVIADGGGNPEWIALDLLSQAEHDPDARAYLLTDDANIANQVNRMLPTLIASLPLPSLVQTALEKSAILVFGSLSQCADAANQIAPEHLLLHLANPDDLVGALHNYGAVFMGYNATVAYGDYCAGPNHTLPTARAARFCGGLNPLTFLRAQSWLKVDRPAMKLAQMTAAFADIEGLTAHSAAANARIRLSAEG